MKRAEQEREARAVRVQRATEVGEEGAPHFSAVTSPKWGAIFEAESKDNQIHSPTRRCTRGEMKNSDKKESAGNPLSMRVRCDCPLKKKQKKNGTFLGDESRPTQKQVMDQLDGQLFSFFPLQPFIEVRPCARFVVNYRRCFLAVPSRGADCQRAI